MQARLESDYHGKNTVGLSLPQTIALIVLRNTEKYTGKQIAHFIGVKTHAAASKIHTLLEMNVIQKTALSSRTKRRDSMRRLFEKNSGITLPELEKIFPTVARSTLNEDMRSLKKEGIVFTNSKGRKVDKSRSERLNTVKEMLGEGLDVTAIQKELGVRDDTIARYMRELEDRELIPKSSRRKRNGVTNWRGDRIDLVRDLTEMGLGQIEIARLLHYPRATIFNDQEIIKSKEAIVIPLASDAFRITAQRYADFVARKDTLSPRETIICSCVRMFLELDLVERELTGFASVVEVAEQSMDLGGLPLELARDLGIVKALEKPDILAAFTRYWLSIDKGRQCPPSSHDELKEVCDAFKSVFLPHILNQLEFTISPILNALVEQSINQLSMRQRFILRLHYGYGDHKKHTIDEIKDILGSTRTRVRQIKNKAVKLVKDNIFNAPQIQASIAETVAETKEMVHLESEEVIPLSRIEMNGRTLKMLLRNHMHTTEDIRKHFGFSRKAILSGISLFGSTSLKDLEQALKKYGINLGP